MRDELHRRQSAESALRQSEEQYRRLVGLMPAGVYTCDAAGVITFYNDATEKLWGRAPTTGDTDERFCGSFRLWLPDGNLLPHDQTPMAVALREGREFRAQSVTIERPDGSRTHVLVNIDPIRDAQGRVVGAINAFHDITELMQTQLARRESEERFFRFMQNLPGLAWIKDLEGRYVFANASAEDAFQVSGEELYGKRDEEIFPTDIASRFRTNDREALANGSGVKVIETLTDAEGHSRHSIVSKFPIPGPDGRAALVGGVAIDIIDRKQAEAALKAKEAELELIAGTTPLMLTRCGRDLRYRFANRAAAALFGCSPNDMIGQLIPDVMGEEAFAKVRPFTERVLQGESVEFEVELPQTAAGRRWMHVNYAPERDEEGGVGGWIASIVDVSDRKRAEAALREADRRKDEFLALLAHELRNPLAPIRTGLELLKIARGDQKAIDEVRETMERQTRQLVSLVDDLLDVSRITRGKFELQKCRVLLTDVVQSAVEASRPLMDDAGHHFEEELPERPIVLEADPNRLAQVISNLLNNAAKYTPEGGRIRLSAQREENQVVVSVTDTGLGYLRKNSTVSLKCSLKSNGRRKKPIRDSGWA